MVVPYLYILEYWLSLLMQGLIGDVLIALMDAAVVIVVWSTCTFFEYGCSYVHIYLVTSRLSFEHQLF